MRKIQENDSFILRKLFHYLRQYRVFLVLSILFAIISSIFMLYVPILFGQAIDDTIHLNQFQFSIILRTLIFISIFVLMGGLSTWLMNLINNKLTYCIVRDLRSDSMNKIQHLPLQYLDTHSIGDIEIHCLPIVLSFQRLICPSRRTDISH